MPDLLLELLSEEIPARMQGKAADDLRRLITDRLVDAGLTYEGAKAFVTPRRLTLAVEGIPAKQPDLREERKGPRVGAPEAAIAGFLKAAGLASIDEANIQPDKKGDFYVAVINKPGRPAIEVIAEIVPEVIAHFPWPKSMNWGDPKDNLEKHYLVTEAGDHIVTEADDSIVVDVWLKWIRPLHSIVATFGPQTEEPEIVQFKVGGIKAGNVTEGHQFMAPGRFKVRRLDDYAAALARSHVVIDPERRRDMIQTDANNLAFAQGYEVIDDPALLAEVAGLVEWPVVLMGSFEEEYLTIPAEVIRATIRQNQKCFVVRNAATGQLANKFILVANIEASDGGAAIIAGNERVIRARLADAKFFYDTDLKTKLEDRLPKFENIIFHEKLGSQADRIARIESLAVQLAPLVGADVEKTRRAARLCKADLLTDVVGEFPELQGLMGKYYARAQGEDDVVAAACEDHYKPLGPTDRVPSDPIGIAVALADKLDTLVGFWAIDEKPTGSKDPYALRRAALGITRIIMNANLRLRLSTLFESAHDEFIDQLRSKYALFGKTKLGRYKLWPLAFSLDEPDALRPEFYINLRVLSAKDNFSASVQAASEPEQSIQDYHYFGTRHEIADLLTFFADRLKVQLREQGARHDLVDAVFALENQDDLVLVVRRIEALSNFLSTDDGKSLVAGAKRATNILRIEEKKDGAKHSSPPDPQLYRQAEEWELAAAIDTAKRDSETAIAREDFAAAMTAIARLRPHVDAFFDKVTVNADEPALRANRLRLLNEIREATRAVADFSQIEA